MRVTCSRHRRDVSSTLALSTEVTLPRRPAAARKPTSRQALDLVQGVDAGVERPLGLASPLAEVEAAGELAHHEQVGALDALAPERAGVVERRPGPHRPQVGVEAQPGAQAEQALLRPRLVGVGGVPPRPAHRAEQHGVRAGARRQHLVGEGRAVGVDRRPADEVLVPGDGQPVVGGDRVHDLARDLHHLGADPVAREQGDRHLSHRASSQPPADRGTLPAGRPAAIWRRAGRAGRLRGRCRCGR